MKFNFDLYPVNPVHPCRNGIQLLLVITSQITPQIIFYPVFFSHSPIFSNSPFLLFFPNGETLTKNQASVEPKYQAVNPPAFLLIDEDSRAKGIPGFENTWRGSGEPEENFLTRSVENNPYPVFENLGNTPLDITNVSGLHRLSPCGWGWRESPV